MARWWPTISDSTLHGCDYNPELAAWSAENLPFLSVSTNSLEPPLPYEDGKFAFVYALSIFTHLPRELERAWLDELRRVLRPGGHLFFSVSGEGFVDRLSPHERTRYEQGEPVVHFPEGAGTNLCATYHPPSYVRDEMLSGFLEIDYVSPEHHGDEAIRGALRQDGYLVKKLPSS